MKILITQEQFNLLNETKKEKVSCSKCDHSWEIEKEDKHPYLCHMCGYDSKSKKHNYEELENFWKNYKKEEVTEKWSEKYKKSINCNNPKGFSQRAHCQGRKKKELDEYSRTLKMARRQGSGLRFSKSAIKANPSRFRKYSRLQESKTPEIFKSSIEKNLKEYTSNYEWLDSIVAEFTTTNTSAGWKNEYDTPLCMYTVKFNGNKTPSYEQQSSLFDDISFVHSMFFPVEDGKPTCYFSTKSEYPSGDIKSFPSLRTMSENKEESKLVEGLYDLDKIKKALKILSQISTSFGEFVPLEFKLYGYQLRTNDFGKRLDLYIDVDKDGDVYNTMSNYWHDLSNQLLDIFEMLGIRDERYMKPMYDFKFNKRPLYNIETV
jgi:hypothetical protein